MQFLVLSDSHGRADRLVSVCAAHPDIAALLFLGDGLSDLSLVRARFPRLTIRAVRGNCDGLSLDTPALEEDTFDLFGHRVFMMHGHRAGVKGGDGAARSLALARGADILLYGHTHRPLACYDPDGPLYVMNPGSIGAPPDGHPSYGILDILPGGVMLSHGTCPDTRFL